MWPFESGNPSQNFSAHPQHSESSLPIRHTEQAPKLVWVWLFSGYGASVLSLETFQSL